VLRARKVRPELLYDDLVPELEVSQDAAGDPQEDALVADSVAWALLVVLDSLTPAERLAFVLHDVFAVPFEEVGAVLGRSRDATKMLASRARRKVRGTPAASAAGRQQQREVVDAFLAAARDGDFEALLRVLDPDVTLHIHGTRDVVVKSGATEVAQTFLRGHGRVTARRALVNGEPGVVAWGVRGKPFSVMACTVAQGRLVEIRSLTDRHRLARLDLPDASRGTALGT
jgi:RNA polymerase sigma-70 factor (ECF subfamily)